MKTKGLGRLFEYLSERLNIMKEVVAGVSRSIDRTTGSSEVGSITMRASICARSYAIVS